MWLSVMSLAAVPAASALLACQARAPAAAVPASSASATVSSVLAPTPPAAVTMLAPVGPGPAVVASVVPVGKAGAAGQVEVVAGHPVVASALEPTLLASQQKLFRGEPVGSALGGVLREGQAVEATVSVTAGCYAAVAISPSLSLLGLEIGAAELKTPLSVRSSQGVASLGGGGECVRLGEGEVRLRVSALGGAGPAVARIFAR